MADKGANKLSCIEMKNYAEYVVLGVLGKID